MSATRRCVFCVCVCVCVFMCGHDGLSDKKRGTIIRPSPTQSVGCVTVRVCAAFPIEMRQNGGIQILIIPFPPGGAKAAFQSEETRRKLSLSLSHLSLSLPSLSSSSLSLSLSLSLSNLSLSLFLSLSLSLHDMHIC